ncbi:VOC family protein [Subtercola lobariae]|uniref:Glyoxalase n=1 Tax=Subtercola lobariae TaxID=1588641 RepID=A0A917BDD1_9MICO|nr:VOC family protein [Subtercola lobariae]GGF34373.1 glyoxalase [Subtercola lobariae]
MTIIHTLSVSAVSDLEVSAEWYERMLGEPPTNVPTPGILAEWRVTSNGWLQVTVDAARAGTSMVNLAVDNLAATIRDLASRGISAGETQHANTGVDLATLTDPDGNTITLIGNFREHY